MPHCYRINFRSLSFAVATMTMVCGSPLVISQEAGPGPSAGLLEEVLVTARRRGEDLSRVPTTMSVLGAEALAQRSIVNQSDLQIAVPGLIVRETQSNNQLNYAIRGQTVDAFSGTATAVVPYVNEVPFTAGGVASFYDLESIQVLKGPQGTLFGRNATGGAVLSTTTRPGEELGGHIKAGAGNYNLMTLEGAIDIPLVSDKLLFRGAATSIERDGYIDNLFTGDFFNGIDSSEPGEVDRYSLRGSLLARPNDRFENLTVYQYERAKGNNSGTQLYSYNQLGETTPDGTPLNTAAAFLLNPTLVDLVFGQGSWGAYLAAHPGANPEGIEGALRDQQKKYDFWEASQDSASYHRSKDWFLTNTTTLHINDNLLIKNIFGYSESEAQDATDQLGDPWLLISNYNVATGEFANDVQNDTLSNEIQLQGETESGSLVYILGAYYQEIDNTTFYPQSYFELTPYNPPATTTSNWESNVTAKAVFLHGTFDLGVLADIEGLSVSAGARYSEEEVSLDHQPGGTYFGLPSEDAEFDEPSWNIGLEYQANDELFFYAVSRRSWRAGGINGVAPPTLGPDFPNTDKFDSEIATDFEIGLKYTGAPGGIPTRMSLSLFTMEVEDSQRVLFPANPVNPSLGVVGVTVNVPEMQIDGVELELSMAPTEWLDFGVSASYNDAEFSDNKAVVFDQAFVYGPVADTPEWTGSLYTLFTLPVDPNWGIMTLRADVYAQSNMYFSNNNDTISPHTKLPGYELLNLRYDWQEIMGSDFGLSAFVRNATEEEYYVGGLPLGVSLGANSANVGRPRMYGVELMYSF